MNRLESDSMPNNTLQENDNSVFDSLDGNDLTHPLETTLNRSGEIGSGPDGSADESSRLIGSFDDIPRPETKPTPSTKPPVQAKGLELEDEDSQRGDSDEPSPMHFEMPIEVLQRLVDEANQSRPQTVSNPNLPSQEDIAPYHGMAVATPPGRPRLDDILSAAQLEELNIYGEDFVTDLRRGVIGIDGLLGVGEIDHLEATWGKPAIDQLRDLARPRAGTPGAEAEVEKEGTLESYFRSDAKANITARFQNLERDPDRQQGAWDILEDFLGVAEERGEELEGGRVNQMFNAIDRGLTWDKELRIKLMNMLNARYKYHNASIYALYDGGKKLAQAVSEIRQVEHDTILKMPLVRQSIYILEADNGLFFRRPGKPGDNVTIDVTSDPDTLGHEVGMMNTPNQWLQEKKAQFLAGELTDNDGNLSPNNLSPAERAQIGIGVGNGPDQYTAEYIKENMAVGQDLGNFEHYDDRVRIAIRAGLVTRDEVDAISPGGTGFTPEQQIELLTYNRLAGAERRAYLEQRNEEAVAAGGTFDRRNFLIRYRRNRDTLQNVAAKVDLMVFNFQFNRLNEKQQAAYKADLSDDARLNLEASLDANKDTLDRVPAEIEKRRRLDAARHQVDRAFSMAEKSSQLFMTAATYDGPRFKRTQEQKDQGLPGTLVQSTLEPIIKFDVEEKDMKDDYSDQLPKGHYEVNLKQMNGLLDEYDRLSNPSLPSTLSPVEKEERKKQILEQTKALRYVRANQNFRIGMAWDKAWIDFYKNDFGEIDIANSVTVNTSSGVVGNQIFNLITLDKGSTPNSGRAEPLRKFGYAGGLSVLDMSGRRSAVEQMENAYTDRSIIQRRWAPRIEGVPEYNDAFGKFIDDPVQIYSPDLKPLHELLGRLRTYVPQQDRLVFGEYLTEGILKFVKREGGEYFKDYRKLDTIEILNRTKKAFDLDFITKDAQRRIETEVEGNWVMLKYHARKLDWPAFFWVFLHGITTGKVPK